MTCHNAEKWICDSFCRLLCFKKLRRISCDKGLIHDLRPLLFSLSLGFCWYVLQKRMHNSFCKQEWLVTQTKVTLAKVTILISWFQVPWCTKGPCFGHFREQPTFVGLVIFQARLPVELNLISAPCRLWTAHQVHPQGPNVYCNDKKRMAC